MVAPGATAAEPRRAPALTDFGFRADVYGVKLVTDNVEAFDVKDAHAQLRCTRAVGQSVEQTSAVSVPDNPLIHVAASTSRTDTYREGDRNGVRGTNTIGDIRIGGTVNGVATPSLVIEGLTTTADAFHTPQGFGHAESFDFAGIRLELLQGTPLQGTPLEQLLAPLDQVTATVFEGTNEAANQVFEVLRSATAPIQIPGLGSIALGKVRGDRLGQAGHLGGDGPRDRRRRRRSPPARGDRVGQRADRGAHPGRRVPCRRHRAGLPGAAGRPAPRRRAAQEVAAVRGHPRPHARPFGSPPPPWRSGCWPTCAT